MDGMDEVKPAATDPAANTPHKAVSSRSSYASCNPHPNGKLNNDLSVKEQQLPTAWSVQPVYHIHCKAWDFRLLWNTYPLYRCT